jgi:hypothetical protein
VRPALGSHAVQTLGELRDKAHRDANLITTFGCNCRHFTLFPFRHDPHHLYLGSRFAWQTPNWSRLALVGAML